VELRPGYRESEIGLIPEDWEVESIRELASITTGSKNTQDREKNGLYPFFVRSQTVERINSWSFDGEAVLTAGDGVGTGKVFHYINGKFDVHQRVYRISDFSPRLVGYFFFLYFSNHFYSRIMQMTAKSSVDSVRMEMIAGMQVPVPPTTAEQSAIANAISDVDALVAAQDALIAKKRAIKQGVMQELLTGKRRLPGFSGEWVVNPLGEIAHISKGQQLHTSESDDGGIYPHYNGGMEPSGFTAKFNTPAFTIAISEGGNSCGYVQRIARPFWCGGHCYAVVPKAIDPGFLFHALKGRQSDIMGLRVGSGLPNVQKSAIKAFDLRFPSETAEQVAISEVLSEMDTEISALEANRAKTAQLKQGMMQALLTGRIRLV
jgi:type I restriction enzyme, S subunit